MGLRKHQQAFYDICQKIGGESDHEIICSCTPGAGKSALPLIAMRWLCQPYARNLCWVVPRDNLRRQAEKGFVDPFMRELIGHSAEARAALNEPDPCRGTRGYITTFHSIAANPRHHWNVMNYGKWVLVLDEMHHLPADDAVWTEALEPMLQRADIVIHMSGTLERGDEKPIAFLPYVEYRDRLDLDLTPTDRRHVIRYSRSDALLEGSICDIYFEIVQGTASWLDTKGNLIEDQALGEASGKIASQALTAALKTEYAFEVIRQCAAHWQSHKKSVYPDAQMLVVAPNIKDAKRYLSELESMGIGAEIATSDDSTDAKRAIKKLKAGKLGCLVSVGMVAEGMDAPMVTHIAALTRIRSKPWIEQMIARANRLADGKHYGVVFCPDDPMMRDVINEMRLEQERLARPGSAQEAEEVATSGGGFRPEITPLSSSVVGTESAALSGPVAKPPKTASEKEMDFRKHVENRVRQISRMTGDRPRSINSKLKSRFGKSRNHMNAIELAKVAQWVDRWYNNLTR